MSHETQACTFGILTIIIVRSRVCELARKMCFRCENPNAHSVQPVDVVDSFRATTGFS